MTKSLLLTIIGAALSIGSIVVDFMKAKEDHKETVNEVADEVMKRNQEESE